MPAAHQDDRVRRAYDALADRYIELLGSTAGVHVDDLELISRRCSGSAGVVLDVGCGPGHLSAHLQSLGVDVIGVDQVDRFVEHARLAHPGTRFGLATMQQLPFRSGSVAGVLAWYSLIHLPPDELDEVLLELRRVVAPGGTLVVGCFDGDRVEPFDHQVVTAYRWPVDELASRLRGAGFVEVERQRRPGIDQAGSRPHAALVAVAA